MWQHTWHFTCLLSRQMVHKKHIHYLHTHTHTHILTCTSTCTRLWIRTRTCTCRYTCMVFIPVVLLYIYVIVICVFDTYLHCHNTTNYCQPFASEETIVYISTMIHELTNSKIIVYNRDVRTGKKHHQVGQSNTFSIRTGQIMFSFWTLWPSVNMVILTLWPLLYHTFFALCKVAKLSSNRRNH